MKYNREKTVNTKLLFSLGVVFIVLPIISLIIKPVQLYVKYDVRISEGSWVYNLLKTELKSVTIRVYLFNVTNSVEFLAGDDDRLRLTEVGPFTYQEYRRMEDSEIDEEAGLMRYTLRTRGEFVPNESICDPKDVNITAPNMIALAVASKVGKFSAFIKFAFNLLLNSIKSKPIINERAYNLMWGYDEPLLSIGKKFLPFVDYDSLAMLKQLFDENMRTRIEFAITDDDKFQIKTIDNSTGILIRKYGDENMRGRCNTYEDTYEGIGFPFGLKPGKKLRLYRQLLCRMMDLQYVGTENVDYGPEVLKYKFDDQVYSNTDATECLCEESCIDGVTDMSPCFYGLGIAFSNGHFYKANPNIYKRIVGMNPDEKKHGSEFLIDTITGSVLKSRFTLQVNIIVNDVKYNNNFKSFSNMVVPFANIIVEHQIPDNSKDQFILLHNISPILMHFAEAVLFTIGAGCLIRLFYTRFIKMLFPSRSMGCTYSRPNSIILEKSDRFF